MNTTFSNYLEKLRISRNISRNDFVSGILSERQYRRYLKGESTMPNDKISSLVGKLGLDLTYVYSNYFSKESNEKQYVESIYDFIKISDYKSAYELINEKTISEFNNVSNKQLFEVCKVICEKELLLKPDKLSIILMQELVGYPECLEKSEISFNELISLLFISNFFISEKKDESILNYLTDIIDKKELHRFYNSRSWLPSIYFTIARSHGILGNYDKVIEISSVGIKFCMKNDIMNSLNHLIYLKAYSHYKLGETEECKTEVRHVFNLLSLQKNKSRTDHFHELIKKHMHLSPESI